MALTASDESELIDFSAVKSINLFRGVRTVCLLISHLQRISKGTILIFYISFLL